MSAFYRSLPLLATLACVPEARLDPCVRCAGVCDEGLCELGAVEGAVRDLVASPTGLYACAEGGDGALLHRIDSSGEGSRTLGELPLYCAGVQVDGAFVYVGINDAAPGIYRADLAGGGLHLAAPFGGLSQFAVHDGEIAATRGGQSTPLVFEAGVARPLAPFAQSATEATGLVAISDGRLLWTIPATREVLLTDRASSGRVLYDGKDASEPNPPPLLIAAADGGVAYVVDDDQLIELSVAALRAPRPLASDLRQPTALVVRPSDVVVAEADALRAYPTHRGDTGDVGAPRVLAKLRVDALATREGRLFAARGGVVYEVLE